MSDILLRRPAWAVVLTVLVTAYLWAYALEPREEDTLLDFFVLDLAWLGLGAVAWAWVALVAASLAQRTWPSHAAWVAPGLAAPTSVVVYAGLLAAAWWPPGSHADAGAWARLWPAALSSAAAAWYLIRAARRSRPVEGSPPE